MTDDQVNSKTRIPSLEYKTFKEKVKDLNINIWFAVIFIIYVQFNYTSFIFYIGLHTSFPFIALTFLILILEYCLRSLMSEIIIWWCFILYRRKIHSCDLHESSSWYANIKIQMTKQLHMIEIFKITHKWIKNYQ